MSSDDGVMLTELYDAAKKGNLKRVTLLVEQGVDKNQTGGHYKETALTVAAGNGHGRRFALGRLRLPRHLLYPKTNRWAGRARRE